MLLETSDNKSENTTPLNETSQTKIYVIRKVEEPVNTVASTQDLDLKEEAKREIKKLLEESINVSDTNYGPSGRSNNVLYHQGHKYIRNNAHGNKIYWKCTKWHSGCKARAITLKSDPSHCVTKNDHLHLKNTD